LLLFRRTRSEAGLTGRRRTWWCRVRTTAIEAGMHRRLLDYARLVCARREGAPAARLAMTVLLKRALSSPASLARSVERRLELLGEPERGPEAQPALPFTQAEGDDSEPAAILAVPGLSDPDEERRRLEAILHAASAASRGESKLRVLARLIRRTSEPAVVFTEYRDTLHHIGAMLPGFDIAYLHGGLSAADRRDALERFVQGGARLLLATDAASEGLNLHHRCRLVVNVELPWSPVRLEQRVGRVDRIGQRRRAHAVHLVGRDTAEERIVARLLARQARAQDALASPRAGRTPHDSGGFVEGDIERAVIDGAPLVDRHVQLSPSRDRREAVLTPDLNDVAAKEAARIVAARRLGSPDRADVEIRPVATVLRRRRPGRRRQLIWVYRLPCVDGRDVVSWEAMYGALMTPGHAEHPLPPARLALELRRDLRDAPMHAQEEAQLEAARAWADAVRGPGVQRLEAIAEDLRRTRARIAALQGSLFDRRADRAAAAQISVLEAALDRCALRLASLAALGAIEAGPRELVFAVALA
jgi:hypothetical protein